MKELSNLRQEARSEVRGIGEAQLMLITSMRFFFAVIIAMLSICSGF